jgi:hypothetical protein
LNILSAVLDRTLLAVVTGAILFMSAAAGAATLSVGPDKTYRTITAAYNAAVAGDTIAIDAGTYPNETIFIGKNDLTLRGVGGRAHIKWDNGDYLTNTALIGNGKGILVIGANNVTIESIELSGAKVADENGAGIRYEGGNLTIRDSYFHHNENGILGAGGSTSTLLIENSVFERNGYCIPTCAHNVYIGNMGALIFRFNKSVNSKEGHTLKSRANVNDIVGNYFSTKDSDGSYEADFPNGGTVYFIGNIVEQGVATGNSYLLAYAEEGATNPNPALHLVNNTFINLRSAGTYITASGSPVMTVKNNIFSGAGSIGVAADASNKVLPASTFVNLAGSDYHLAAGSGAIDAGVNPGMAGTYDLTPKWEYVEPAGNVSRTISGATLDAGAYEYNAGGSAIALSGITANPSAVTGGASSTGTVTLTAGAPAGDASVALSSSIAEASVPPSVTVTQGASSASFPIATTTVSSTTVGTLTATYDGVSKNTTFTVNPPPPPPVALSSLSISPTSVVGGTSATGTVTLSAAAPAGGTTVTLSSSNVSLARVPVSVAVAEGTTTKTFTITTKATKKTGDVTITASYSGVNKTAMLTVGRR